MQRSRYLLAAILVTSLVLVAGFARPAHAQAVTVGATNLAPTQVWAFPRNAAAFVTWLSPSQLAVGYDVYRRNAGDTPDKAVLVAGTATTPTTLATFFVDPPGGGKALTNGQNYVYFVKAVYRDSAGKLFEGSGSPDAIVTPSAPITTAGAAFFPYTIDTVYPGRATVSGSTLTIRGSGGDLYDAYDGQTYFAGPVSGDFIAQVTLLALPTNESSSGSTFASVGLEIRAGLERGAPYAYLKVNQNRSPAYMFEGRKQLSTNFSDTTNAPSIANANPPVTLQFIRKGQQITAAFSENGGASFTTIQTEDYSGFPYGGFPAVVYVGVAANGHSDGNFVDGMFDLSSFKITAAP